MECYQSVTNALTIVGKRTVVTFFLLLVHVFCTIAFNSLLSSAMKIDQVKQFRVSSGQTTSFMLE